ncbi:hypothetical protein [Litorimonas sp. WD9-15]|uniref:hypothetical protein n=1 Tax=Litorimonas sp. WD9-15 TaxID=3418716 RepID=UPI003D013144
MASGLNRASAKVRLREQEMMGWLRDGMGRADGRLALFDTFGEPVDKAIIQTAIAAGLAEPWFASPMRPQWTVCRLTAKGRRAATK